ncbi:MAG: endonuclease/exonuclease/phosphatase family protein [bacterium]
MNRRLLIVVCAPALALLLLLGSCGTTEKSTAPEDVNPFAAATVGTDTTLEIITWNLENFAKNGAATVAYVADAVSALDVDIVALQEVMNVVQFRALDDALPGWDGYRAVTAYADMNLAYLYRNSSPLVVESIYEILADEYALPRSPLVLQGSFAGQPLVVINNHYKCCGDNRIEPTNERDEETRRRDASILLDDYIARNFSGVRVVVVGDFNDELTDDQEDNVFDVFLQAPDRYRFVDLDIASGPDSGWSYPSWPSHLDHILITSDLFDAMARPDTEVRVLRLYDYLSSGWSEYDKNISDHLPVLLRLKP